MNLHLPNYSEILENYSDFECSTLKGRYLKEEDLQKTFRDLSHKFKIKNEGYSEADRIITSFHLGSGSEKILIWSQMHGNETTTTKSIFDLLSYFRHHAEFARELFKVCSFVIVPVLNPDGAKYYTRANINGVDLNRDAFHKTQSESKVLYEIYKAFNPDVCFNMHDQRTIFSAGNSEKPATLSFLSPSFNEEREINEVRETSMSLISSANETLQEFIPGQVGRYDDGFNINCIGDFLQKEGTPTVLFEAGHYPADYDREQTRRYIFIAMLDMITNIATNQKTKPVESYFEIPENEKLYYDVIIRNVLHNNKVTDVAIQYQETLIDERIDFVPIIERIENLELFYGHREIDAKKQSLELDKHIFLREGELLGSFSINNNVIVV